MGLYSFANNWCVRYHPSVINKNIRNIYGLAAMASLRLMELATKAGDAAAGYLPADVMIFWHAFPC